MAIFTFRAEVGTTGEGEFSVFSSKFGDGYEQITPNGPNNENRKWSVVTSGKGPYHRQVLAFIREQRGAPFQWKAPNTAALGWFKCVRYRESDEGGDYWTLTMEFEGTYMP